MPTSSNGKLITILSSIFIVVVGAVASMSISGDAKLDNEKTDKSVFTAHKESDKVLRDRDYEQMQAMDKKLDKLLER